MSIATQQEILDALGVNSVNNLVTLAWKNAEAKVKAHLGYDIERATGIVEYFPKNESTPGSGEFVYDSIGGQAVWTNLKDARAAIVSRLPLVSIAEIKTDPEGFFGQKAGSFSGAALTAGTDYYFPTDEDGFSWSGIIRFRTVWYDTPGSVKVTYTAGLQADDFNGTNSNAKWSFFRDAVLGVAQFLYMRGKQVAGGQQMMQLSGEGLGGGRTVQYVDSFMRGLGIPDDVAATLDDCVHMAKGMV